MPKGFLKRLPALLAAALLLAWGAPARAGSVNCILIFVKPESGIASATLISLLWPVQKSLVTATHGRASLFLLFGKERLPLMDGDENLLPKCSQETAIGWLTDMAKTNSHLQGHYSYRPDIWRYNSNSNLNEKTNPIVLTFGPNRLPERDCPFPPEEQAVWGLLALYYTGAPANNDEANIRKDLINRLTRLEKRNTVDRAFCKRLTGNDVYPHTLGILQSIRRSGGDR